MNLRGIANGAIQAVNPDISAQIYASDGYTTSPNGKQVPKYLDPVTIKVQVQALQYNDIVQLDGLNIQGERRAVYIDGSWDGIIRVSQKGGDLLKFPDRLGGPTRTWLVAFVFEYWSPWTKLAVTLQND